MPYLDLSEQWYVSVELLCVFYTSNNLHELHLYKEGSGARVDNQFSDGMYFRMVFLWKLKCFCGS